MMGNDSADLRQRYDSEGRTGDGQFETSAAADRQITGGSLIRTGAKTAALALIEHKEHTNMKPKNTI